MKSFLKLIKNELIKIFAQTSYKVLIAILLAIFIIIPIGIKGISSILNIGMSSFYSIEDDIELYEELASNEFETELNREYYSVYADALKLYRDNNMDFNSWQYGTMFQSYLSLLVSERAYFLLSNGEITIEEIGESEFSYYIEFDADSSQYSEMYNYAHTERIDYEKLILNAEISSFYDKYINDIKASASADEEYLLALRLEAVEKPSEALNLEIECVSKALSAYNSLSAVFLHLKENNIDTSNWKYSSAILLDGLVYEISSSASAVLTEEEFSKDIYSKEQYGTYQQYCEKTLRNVVEKHETALAIEYSVKNNVPTQASQELSTKTVFRSSAMSSLTFIMYFAIVVSSLMISSEFTSGTSRLLFIRPHKRNRILMSKYTTIICIIVALNIASIIVSFLMSILVNGAGDIFVADLIVNNGEVKRQNSILAFLGTLILANFRILLVTTFTFMVASLTKKGALSICLGLISEMVVSSVGSLICSFAKISSTKFTMLPYYNMEIFSANQVEYHLSGNSIFTPNYVYQYSQAQELSIFGGIANYALWFGILLTILLLIFKKQEIKN